MTAYFCWYLVNFVRKLFLGENDDLRFQVTRKSGEALDIKWCERELQVPQFSEWRIFFVNQSLSCILNHLYHSYCSKCSVITSAMANTLKQISLTCSGWVLADKNNWTRVTTTTALLRTILLTQLLYPHSHTRPVCHLDFSDITESGTSFLISACKGMSRWERKLLF